MPPEQTPAAPPGPNHAQPAGPAKPAAPSRSHVIRRRVWTLGRLFILFVALVITYGAFFFTAFSVSNKTRVVKTPDLKGKTVTEADAIVKRVGLVLKLDPNPVPDPATPAGRVVTQDPVPGYELRPARAVRVRLSEGQRAAPVPSVNGQPERTAKLALEGARLTVTGQAEIKSSDYPAGTIVAQDPPPGARSSSVRLLINRPEDGLTYVVPDLVGLSYARVLPQLRQLPFRLATAPEFNLPNYPSGTIVQQVPPAGSQIRAQDTITLWTNR